MLLALDTSTHNVGLALYNGVQVLGEVAWNSRDYHTVELAPAVSDLLAKADLQVTDLKVLAVATGPGSFTGLRIGLALAKGLALAQHLPLVGVPTLDILAASQPVREEPLAAVLRAGRGRLAVGWYQAGKDPYEDRFKKSEQLAWLSTGEVEVLTAAGLSQRIHKPTFVCGELTADEQRLLARKRKNVILASPAQSLRRPAFLAELAWRRWQAGLVDDPAALSPFYLHYNEPIPG